MTNKPTTKRWLFRAEIMSDEGQSFFLNVPLRFAVDNKDAILRIIGEELEKG